MTAAASAIVTRQRYGQWDLHDIHRAAERMRTLLEANRVAGLTAPERVMLGGCQTIVSHCRRNAVGEYSIRGLQLGLDEEDAA